MDNIQKKQDIFSIIASILLIILAIINIQDFIQSIVGYFEYGESYYLVLIFEHSFSLIYPFFAIGLLIKNDKLLVYGGIVYILFQFLHFICYSFMVLTYGLDLDLSFIRTILWLIPTILQLIICDILWISLFVANLTDKLINCKSEINKIWFVPSLAYFIINFFLEALGKYSIYGVVLALLQAATFLFSALSIVKPTLIAQKPLGNFNQSQEHEGSIAYSSNLKENSNISTLSQPEGYCDMLKHILLLIFTFGIWDFIWVYRTTYFLNRVKNEELRNPTTQLLLFIFVPFYSIYWIYKSSERIDKLAHQKSIDSDIKTVCLLFAIFFYLLAPIFMQDKINNIVKPSKIYVPEVNNESTASHDTQEPDTSEDIKNNKKSDVTIIADNLKTYKDLLDQGIITQEEFDTKKKEILGL